MFRKLVYDAAAASPDDTTAIVDVDTTMHSLSSDSSEVQHLYAQIASHVETALRLRRDLNACAPINQLPSAVLARIFTHQAIAIQDDDLLRFELDSHEETARAAHKPIYAWLSVARVCRQWREIALGCPELWAFVTIDPRVPHWQYERFKERARGLAPRVVVHEVYADSHCARCMSDEDAAANRTAGLELLRRILGRTTQLSIFVDDSCGTELWDVLKGIACPRLEALRISSTILSAYTLRPADAPDEHLTFVPPGLFASHTPALAALALKGVGFTFDNPLLCGSLRRLNIAKCCPLSSAHAGRSADLPELLAALHRMPFLDSLKLRGPAIWAVVHISPDAQMHAVPASLPCLRLLRAPLAEEPVRALLGWVRMPPTAVCHFTHSSPSVRPVTCLSNLLAGLSVWALACGSERPSFGTHEPWPPCKLWIGDAPPQAPAPAPAPGAPALPDSDSWADLTATHPPRFVVECDGTRSGPLMTQLLAALDLRPLRLLAITGGWARAHDRAWMDGLLARARKVATLRVEGELAVGLGALLARWARPADMDARVRMHREESDTAGNGGGGVVIDDGEDDDLPYRGPFEYVGYAEATGELERRGYEAGAGAGAGMPLPFPELRRIEISRVDFPIRKDLASHGQLGYRYVSHLQYWAVLNRSSGPYGFDVPGFVKGLRARVEQGATPVERVDFAQCQCVQRERLRPLVEAVREVWWDGKRLTLDDLGSQEPWSGTQFTGQYNRYSRAHESDDEA
ncbi:hypothetical protein C8Q73DRAFT_836349 [Cubamyces lactineus]|nr:hypothetical protein C8Q73DRAFT_836349 [Cubamyces lactineus]